MRDVLPTLIAWDADGYRFATATVTQTTGSSPRPVGSVMGVREDGVVCGSVSAGCVEAAVIEAAIEAIGNGAPRELEFHGLTEGDLWEVGLSCGGRINVWIDPEPAKVDPVGWATVVERVSGDRPVVVATAHRPFEKRIWTPENAVGFEPALGAAIRTSFDRRLGGEVEIEGRKWLLNVVASRDRLVVVGAVHIAVSLVNLAKELGFETVVIDPRTGFADVGRFAACPDRIAVDWPEPALEAIGITDSTYAVVLTHDPKIDDAALAILLRSAAPYVGALGSRSTHAQRKESLRELGFTDTELDRIHGPVGLDIGARTPQEIALSIIAEIVQVRNAPR